MKITLNESIPENRRPEVERLVRAFASTSEIQWRHSRFPRFVMFVEPGRGDGSEPESSSIFESPRAGNKSVAAMISVLEDNIRDCLAKAEPGH